MKKRTLTKQDLLGGKIRYIRVFYKVFYEEMVGEPENRTGSLFFILRRTTMKETMIFNCVSIIASSIAIAAACKITRSALPLLAFTLVPRFSVSSNSEDK